MISEVVVELVDGKGGFKFLDEMLIEIGVFLHLKFEFSGVDIELSNESFEALFDVLDLDLFHVL
jgi:hypothetical protein